MDHQADAGELDLAIVIRPPFALQSDLRWTTLESEPFRLICALHHPR
jgi:DNA-binding transcriptional LysR family regulator